MTAVLPRASTLAVGADGDRRTQSRFDVRERVAFGVLLVVTAVLYLWNLSASGWANAFYSAAAQAGGQNWTAMLFGSSDASNAITVDKTPAALWVMDVSVRLFGLNSWSVLVPQALEGVAAVALLYAAVRRAAGTGRGAARGRGLRADTRGRVDVPVQQPRRAAGADARRGRVLRAARLRARRQPVVAGRRRRRGGLRVPGQDAAGVPGAARLRRRLSDRRRRAAARPRCCGWRAPWRRWSSRAAGTCCSSSCGRRRRGRTSAAHSRTASSNWPWATTVSAGSPATSPVGWAT